MRLGDILEFRKDLYFEGAVQIDWFYTQERAAKVAENFVFHGKQYFGLNNSENNKRIDTISFVEEIAKKKDENFNPLTLAIADYGTGKSHLAVTLAQLLSGPEYMPDTYNKIINNIEKIDKADAKLVKELCSDKDFVLVVNGMRDFNLNSEILKATQKTLQLYGLSDKPLRNLNRSLVTAQRFFERNFDTLSSQFEKFAYEYGWHEAGENLKAKIKNEIIYDDTAFAIVNKVYENINGQEIHWDEGLSAASVLEMLINEYCGVTGQFDRVVILFDEFGRYLEYASGVTSAKSGDSALQQIFEVAQNAEGQLQVINFIQSDIKTYLQRVDKTKNISRYIGRYDESDKYYLSSNLETVFANLIQRKNQEAFAELIIGWQKDNEDLWKQSFENINKWTVTKGIWKDYVIYRKVIVEGIYPMHPLSTFMLTQLSDYLQNRSSLTLISHYINELSDANIRDNPILVMPYQLMTGDLFVEMLSAEQEGRQKSRQCILFDNVLRKYGDKLSDNSLKVLRSNLILRILRFRTKSYDEVLEAISFCSGLTINQINQELQWLVNEYGILGYDDHACCFDFNEESNGAHDYKILKNRLISNATIDDSILEDVRIKKLAAVDTSMATNFALYNNISTSEWCFAQEMYDIKHFDKDKVNFYIEKWKNAHDATTPKGTIIWLYANKDTEDKYMTRAMELSQLVDKLPIAIMLLNDEDNRLYNTLLEYDVLNHFKDEYINKYARHYQDDLDNVTKNLTAEFNELKKRRVRVTGTGFTNSTERLSTMLTNMLANIYPRTLPFFMDGFITKSNNIAPKITQYYITIIKLLLGGNIDENTVHSFPVEIRNRFETLLMTSSRKSWMCVNKNYQIIPPEEKKVSSLYLAVVNTLEKHKELPLKALYKKLILPPYGLNQYSFTLLIAVIAANNNYRLRIVLNDQKMSIANWQNEIIIKDKKLEVQKLLASKLVLIDVSQVAMLFTNIFKQINTNTNLAEVPHLRKKLNELMTANDLPAELETQYLITQNKLDEGIRRLKKWIEYIDEAKEEYNTGLDNNDIYNALKAISMLHEIPTAEIFNGYEFSNEFRSKMNEIENNATGFIRQNFDEFINNLRCNDVQSIKSFNNHCKKLEKMFRELYFNDYAEAVFKQKEKELADINKIKEKQNFNDDVKAFLKDSIIDEYVSYVKVNDYIKQGKELLQKFALYKNTLGSSAQKTGVKIQKRLSELNNVLSEVKEQMNAIWDDIYNAKTTNDLLSIIPKINLIQQKGLRDIDEKSFKMLQDDLMNFTDDSKLLSQISDDRSALKKCYEKLREKYKDSEYDFVPEDILENDYQNKINELNAREQEWKEKYMSLGDKSQNSIYRFKSCITMLPNYLTEETIKEIQALDKEADEIISVGKIDNVIYYFEKLSADEQAECLKKLNELAH